MVGFYLGGLSHAHMHACMHATSHSADMRAHRLRIYILINEDLVLIQGGVNFLLNNTNYDMVYVMQ